MAHKTQASIEECFVFLPAGHDRVFRSSDSDALTLLKLTPSWTELLERIGALTRTPSDRQPALLNRVRKIGLPRPRSASEVSWLAAIACCEVLKDRVAIPTALLVCTTTAAISVSFQFESCGAEEGWDLVDPFWLPNSIPSSVATSVFPCLGVPGLACGFQGGVRGFYSALEHGAMLLEAGVVQRAVVVLAEARAGYQSRIVSTYGLRDNFPSAAAGIVLTKTGSSDSQPRLTLWEDCDNLSDSTSIAVSQYDLTQSLVAPLMLFVSCSPSTKPVSRPTLIRVLVKETTERFAFGIETVLGRA